MDHKYVVELPPFSNNKLWAGRRFKTNEYKAWRQAFVLLIRSQLREKVVGWCDVTVHYYIHNYAMRDTGNSEKALTDALVECGCIQDDRFIVRLTQEKFKIKKPLPERIEIFVTPRE